jgi:hypothetical protein
VCRVFLGRLVRIASKFVMLWWRRMRMMMRRILDASLCSKLIWQLHENKEEEEEGGRHNKDIQ